MAGGYGRGWRHRRVFRSTGVPGAGKAGLGMRGRMIPVSGRAEDGLTEPPLDAKEELKMLEEEEQLLEHELEEVRNTITELKDEKGKEVR